ncbi:alpha/beta hydrolase fold domain-containing protein [Subtercola boreus]|nr:alpha/beta hydrolase fold domain-containing protein [Subtercola boreus]
MPASRPFHLAWFLNFGVDEWNDPWASGGERLDGEFSVDVARTLERAGFDFVLIEDKTAMLGDLDTNDTLCRDLCRKAGASVVSVDCRLAPEHPYPAAIDDGIAALR